MANATQTLSIQQLRAAHQRAVTKLARQQQAVMATQAELTVWEDAIKNAEKASR